MVETEDGQVYLGEVIRDGDVLVIYSGFPLRPKELRPDQVVRVTPADDHPHCLVEWVTAQV